MKLDLTPEQAFFAGTTREFLADKAPTSLLRELRGDPAGFGPNFWRQGADLGWTSLLVAEADGGGSVSGQGLCDLALMAFEFGRHAAPGPLVAANIVAATVARSGTAEQRAELLPGLLSGAPIGSWADAEPRPFERLGAVGLQERRPGGQYLLTGGKAPVEAAGRADLFLVTALLATEGDSGGGLVQLLVPADTPGVSVSPDAHAGHHPPLRAGHVHRCGRGGLRCSRRARHGGGRCRTAAADRAGHPAGRDGGHDGQWSRAHCGVAVQPVFLRPAAGLLPGAQARFADMRAWLEAATAMADATAQHVQEESGRAGEYVSAGKAFLGSYALEVLQECVQFHGGIGVTFEHDLHLYLRRATVDSQLYGTVADHGERLTSILEGREQVHG